MKPVPFSRANITMGTKNFYVVVPGRKTPIASAPVSSFDGDSDVVEWARREYERYCREVTK